MAGVMFGPWTATDVELVSPTEITCTVPDGVGVVDVTVVTDDGIDTLPGGFTYADPDA